MPYTEHMDYNHILTVNPSQIPKCHPFPRCGGASVPAATGCCAPSRWCRCSPPRCPGSSDPSRGAPAKTLKTRWGLAFCLMFFFGMWPDLWLSESSHIIFGEWWIYGQRWAFCPSRGSKLLSSSPCDGAKPSKARASHTVTMAGWSPGLYPLEIQHNYFHGHRNCFKLPINWTCGSSRDRLIYQRLHLINSRKTFALVRFHAQKHGRPGKQVPCFSDHPRS